MKQGIEILGPLITARIKKMARDRLVDGTSFFAAGRVPKFPRSEIKLALLLVKLVNPYEILSNQEEAILRGVTRNTISRMKERKDIPRVA